MLTLNGVNEGRKDYEQLCLQELGGTKSQVLAQYL